MGKGGRTSCERGQTAMDVSVAAGVLAPSVPTADQESTCEYCGASYVPEAPGDTMCSWSCVSGHAYESSQSEQTQPLPYTPDPNAYGAVDRQWLASKLAEFPYVYHLTTRERAAQIQQEGLRAADELGATQFEGAVAPRPGHVYFAEPKAADGYMYEICQIEPEQAVWVRIDLRQIDPARLVPDEDALWCKSIDPAAFGLSDPNASLVGEDGKPSAKRPYRSYGEWAEGERVGAQPGIVEACWKDFGRLALRGSVSPQAISIVEPEGSYGDPADYAAHRRAQRAAAS